MLDLSHPQTQWRFAAAKELDAIQHQVKSLINVANLDREGCSRTCDNQLAELRTLNREHFGNSEFIQASISDLAAGLESFCRGDSADLTDFWEALNRLDSTEGFGTVCI